MLPERLKDARRILAVRMDNIGDIVMLSPALRALKQAFPAAELTLLASPGGAQVAPLLPSIDHVISWRASWQDLSHQMETSSEQEQGLVDLLRQGQFDAAFIFTSFTQSPYPPAYACYLAGIPVRVGQSKEFGGALLTHWIKPQGDETYQVDRNLYLLRQAGIPVGDNHIELAVPRRAQKTAREQLQAQGNQTGQPYICVAPGASASARRYPPEKFLSAVKKIIARTGLHAVIIGSQREMESLAGFEKAARKDPRIKWLVGQTSVAEIAAIVKRAALVIANNSASLHLAEAFCRPMVILYSGTEYLTQWSPRYSPALILNKPVSCSPCFGFTCPYHLECLDFSPDEVAGETVRFLNNLTAPYTTVRSMQSVFHQEVKG